MKNFELDRIYIPIKDRKQARFAKKLLIELGQPIDEDFAPTQSWHTTLFFHKYTKTWLVGNPQDKARTEITFRDLIQKLSCPANTHFYDEEAVEVEKAKAIKCDNELEYEAMYQYCNKNNYQNAGKYKNWSGQLPLYFDLKESTVGVYKPKDYNIFPFSQFAKDNGIKVPLLKSEDNQYIFEFDWVYSVRIKDFDLLKLKIGSHYRGLKDSQDFKIFFDQQAAEKWIEEQKPKSIELQLESPVLKAIVTKDRIDIYKMGDFITRIRESDIELISQAIKDLKG